ncbi:MAG: hypothetical protein R3E83_08450 [Burkholderiaceae bacterium]
MSRRLMLACTVTVLILSACVAKHDRPPDRADRHGEALHQPDHDGPSNRSAPQPFERSAASCDPATHRFTLSIDNAYFLLPVGHRLVLAGEEDGRQIRLEIDVLDQTREIAGVMTRVVSETEWIDGERRERALNYFAQSDDGTVCYFGEDVSFFRGDIEVSRRGSWHAGADGALPGIMMPATVEVDDWFSQEAAPGIAEDYSLVVAIGLAVQTPIGMVSEVIELADWNPLEGDSLLDAEPKLYARGLGLIGDETLRLVQGLPIR